MVETLCFAEILFKVELRGNDYAAQARRIPEPIR